MSGLWSVLYGFLIAIHVLVCIVMMLSILLQAGRSAGLGMGFGGTSQTIFGAGGGASFLAKFTAISAIVFVITSISIAKISNKSSRALERKAKRIAEKMKREKGTEVNLKDLGVEEKSKEEEKESASPHEKKEEPKGETEEAPQTTESQGRSNEEASAGGSANYGDKEKATSEGKGEGEKLVKENKSEKSETAKVTKPSLDKMEKKGLTHQNKGKKLVDSETNPYQ